MSKFEKHLFNQKHFFLAWHFFMHMLIAQYIYIVNKKYQKASVKALIQVNFPVYA